MYPRALMQGNPPSTTSTRLLQINFPSHPFPQFFIYQFPQGNTIEQVERRRTDPMSVLCSPTGPPPHHTAPHHLLLITHQVKHQSRATPFLVTARRCRNVSLAFRDIISPCTHLVLPWLLLISDLVIVPPQCGNMFSWGR